MLPSETEIPSIEHIHEHPGEAHGTIWGLQMELKLLKEKLAEAEKTLDEIVAIHIGYLDPDKQK